VLVGLAHVGRRVVGGEHCLFDDSGEKFHIARGCGKVVGSRRPPGPQKQGTRGTQFLCRARNARAELIKTDSDGLAEIHRRLLWIGRDYGEYVAVREIFQGQAAFLRAEDESDVAAAGKLFLDEGRQFRQRNHRLLGLSVVERGCADDERAIGYRVGQGLSVAGILEKVRGANGRFRLAPMGLVGSNHGEAPETEVGHGPRRRSYIEGIARGDEDDVEAVAMGFGEQGIHCSARQF